jgi:acetyl esterase/lipase
MFKILRFITFICAFSLLPKAQAQQLPNRYVTELFTNAQLQVTNDVVFSTNIPHVNVTNLFGNQIANEETYGQRSVTLRMNIYRPNSTVDTLSKRPVIIFLFGGGFVTGSRTEASMLRLCEAFARRGFVTATADYRLGMNLSDPELAKRAVYRGIQDSRSAVRFFRNNAAAYGVDPNQIFVAGHSAGAFAALHNIYLDKDEERPASTRLNGSRADLGTLDAVGDNKTDAQGNAIDGKANAAMGFAAALGELSYIEGPNDAPGVYFHSSDDNTVLFNAGRPFPSLNLIPGINLPVVQGSNPIAQRANSVGAPHVFYPYTNRGHNVHFNSPNLYSDIAPRGSDFFYDYRLKPTEAAIEGAAEVCELSLSQTYTLPQQPDHFYYDWSVEGGTFVSRNVFSNTVTVLWEANAPQRSLRVVPYSRQLARGASVEKNVSLNRAPQVLQVLNTQLLQLAQADALDINLAELFSDPDGDALSYRFALSGEGIVSANINEANLRIQPLAGGTVQITLWANDRPQGTTCERSLSFTIEVNRAPEALSNIADKVIRFGDEALELNLSNFFGDPDGDALSFTITQSANNLLSITQNAGQIQLTATAIGQAELSILVEDGRGGSLSSSFMVEVLKGLQVISFAALGDVWEDESNISIEASSNRGLPLSLVLVEGNATLAGNLLTPTDIGNVIIRAVQVGNEFYEGAEALFDFCILPRKPLLSYDATANVLSSSRVSGNRWYLNGQLLEAVSGQTLSPTQSGTYEVQIANTDNCADSERSEAIQVNLTVTSLDNLGSWAEVYPNPVQNTLQINFKQAFAAQITLQVSDMLGRVVETRSIDPSAEQRLSIDMSHLQQGIYYLQMQQPQGRAVVKVLKQ